MRMPPLLSRAGLAAATCAALAFAPLHSHAQGGVMNLLNSLGGSGSGGGLLGAVVGGGAQNNQGDDLFSLLSRGNILFKGNKITYYPIVIPHRGNCHFIG